MVRYESKQHPDASQVDSITATLMMAVSCSGAARLRSLHSSYNVLVTLEMCEGFRKEGRRTTCRRITCHVTHAAVERHLPCASTTFTWYQLLYFGISLHLVSKHRLLVGLQLRGAQEERDASYACMQQQHGYMSQ